MNNFFSFISGFLIIISLSSCINKVQYPQIWRGKDTPGLIVFKNDSLFFLKYLNGQHSYGLYENKNDTFIFLSNLKLLEDTILTASINLYLYKGSVLEPYFFIFNFVQIISDTILRKLKALNNYSKVRVILPNLSIAPCAP